MLEVKNLTVSYGAGRFRLEGENATYGFDRLRVINNVAPLGGGLVVSSSKRGWRLDFWPDAVAWIRERKSRDPRLIELMTTEGCSAARIRH